MRIALALLALVVLSVPAAAQSAGDRPISSDDIRKADALVEEGLKIYLDGRLKDAVALFDRALGINPDRLTRAKTRATDQLVTDGRKLLLDGKNEEVLELLAPALRLNRFDPAPPLLMAQAEFNLATRDRDRRRIDRARSLLQETVRRDSAEGRAFLLWGVIGLTIQDYAAAVQGFKGAIERNYGLLQARADLAQALFFLGVQRSRDKRVPADDVIPIFKDAVDLNGVLKDDPQYPESLRKDFQDFWIKSLVNLASLHQRAEELAAAEEVLIRLTKIEPDNYLHWFNLGLFYGRSLKYDKALECYQKALDLSKDPDWMDPYPMMGYIYSQQRKPELAEKYLKAFVAHRPESWDGQIQIASHYFRNGKPELAIEHYERCIEIDPTQIGAIRELSLALTKAQKPVLARQWMELFQAIDKPEAQRARSGYSEENTGGAGAHK